MSAKKRWEDQHWFWRGFQSVVFLYAQCGPCITWRDQRKRKQEAKRDKRMDVGNAKEYPQQSLRTRQPAPFEVNPHWEEEIRLGPGLQKKGRNRGNTKSSRDTTSAGTVGTSDTAGSSLSDLETSERKDRHMFWNSRRYQRADEEIAYISTVDERHEMVYAPPEMSRKGSSVGVSGWSTEPMVKPKKMYTREVRTPPVNDLHPPVVSTVPARKEERAWMTELPPSAAFMSGKKGVTTRSRSDSGNSSLRNGEPSLGKQVGHRIVEDKVKRGETLLYGVQIDPLGSRVDSKLQELDIDRAGSPTSRSSPTNSPKGDRSNTPRKRRRPPPLQLSVNSSPDSLDTSASSSDSPTHPPKRKTYQPIRPRSTNKPAPKPRNKNLENLSPRASSASPGRSPSSTIVPHEDTPSTSSSPPLDNDTPSLRKRKDTKIAADGEPALLTVNDTSLNVLQDLVSSSSLLNSKWIRSPTIEAKIPLPDDSPVRRQESGISELWIQERGRRWSMEI